MYLQLMSLGSGFDGLMALGGVFKGQEYTFSLAGPAHQKSWRNFKPFLLDEGSDPRKVLGPFRRYSQPWDVDGVGNIPFPRLIQG